jgi:hypothetical protein
MFTFNKNDTEHASSIASWDLKRRTRAALLAWRTGCSAADGFTENENSFHGLHHACTNSFLVLYSLAIVIGTDSGREKRAREIFCSRALVFAD